MKALAESNEEYRQFKMLGDEVWGLDVEVCKRVSEPNEIISYKVGPANCYKEPQGKPEVLPPRR